MQKILHSRRVQRNNNRPKQCVIRSRAYLKLVWSDFIEFVILWHIDTEYDCSLDLHPCLMDRRIHQIQGRTIAWLPRSSAYERPPWHGLDAERFKNGLFVRRIFITCHQSWRFVIQASRRIFH